MLLVRLEESSRGRTPYTPVQYQITCLSVMLSSQPASSSSSRKGACTLCDTLVLMCHRAETL
eukprot:COSAG01_NODE_3856_length_5625_cov_3.453312_2_plen_62_part_00